MGMSASQCRLLSLTARMSDLEYEAQSISNSKIRLATQSEAAAKDYSDALNKQSLLIQTGVTSGSTTYQDATASMLTTYGQISATESQRLLKDNSGKLIVSTSTKKNYDKAMNDRTATRAGATSLEDFLNRNGYASTPELATASNGTLTYDAKQVASLTNKYNGADDFCKESGVETDPTAAKYDSSEVAWYTQIFNEIGNNGCSTPGDDNLKDSDWLYNQLNNGNLHLEKWNSTAGDDATGAFEKISWNSGDTELQTRTDSTDMAKAEAEYGVKTAEIQSQDKKFDLSLQNINTEHSAIQTEVDSVKKVIDKNVERSFKIFNA